MSRPWRGACILLLKLILGLRLKSLILAMCLFRGPNDNEDCIERITAFYQNIAKAGARPVSIGGDHSITGGIVQALGGSELAGGQPVSFLHLDAHTDVFTKVDHFLGRAEIGRALGGLPSGSGQSGPKPIDADRAARASAHA
jgi:hypothetical protein